MNRGKLTPQPQLGPPPGSGGLPSPGNGSQPTTAAALAAVLAAGPSSVKAS